MSSSTLCQSCGHRVERRAAAGSAAACRRCRKSLVFDDNTITLFFAETIAAFFKTSLGLPLDRWNVTVRVCNKARLRNNLNNRNCREGGVDHVHTGECLSSVQVNEVLQDTSGSGSISSSATVSTSLPLSASAAAAAAAATPTPTSNTPHLIHTRRVTEIRILEGMHVEAVGRTLVHEALHGWLALWRGQPCGHKACRVCPARLPEIIAEGLCELAAYQYLAMRKLQVDKDSHAYRVIEYTLGQMFQNTAGVYAAGLKQALSSFEGDDPISRRRYRLFFEETLSKGRFPRKQQIENNSPFKVLDSVGTTAWRRRVSATDSPVYSAGGKQGPDAPSINKIGTSGCPPCEHCNRIVEPTKSDQFSFVVKSSDRVVHLSCFRASATKCMHCSRPLYEDPAVQGRPLHRDCFLAYERKHGDVCERCGEPLWEEGEGLTDQRQQRRGRYGGRGSSGSSSAANNNKTPIDNKKMFVRRTSLTNTPSRREVHCRCGDTCKFCGEMLAGPRAVMKDSMLHHDCFLPYQKEYGDKCARCQKPLWRASGTSFSRRTSIVRDESSGQNSEIHHECGDRCVECDNLLLQGKSGNSDGKTITFTEGVGGEGGAVGDPSSGTVVTLHEECFERYQKRVGMVCPRCGDPLWRRRTVGKGSKPGKEGFAKRTCFVAEKLFGGEGGQGKDGARSIEVHVECGDRCAHCDDLLMAEKLSSKSRVTQGRRRGSVIVTEAARRHNQRRGAAAKKKGKAEMVQLHAECFLVYKSTIPSETCSQCGSCLWSVVRGGKVGAEDRFSRRASILTKTDGTKESLCDACAKEYA